MLDHYPSKHVEETPRMGDPQIRFQYQVVLTWDDLG
jgi:hypothetical protein